MLNLNDLLLFVRVVQNKGFAAAGRATGIPKSTLSKRVSALEQHLRVRLVQRTSRSFAVTEAGAEVYRHATAMLAAAEAAEGAVQGRLAEPAGTVRLTASVPTSQFRLATLLPELALTYPKIRLQLHVSDRFVDIVREGFDIAVRSHFAPLPDSDLVHRRLGLQPNILVASADYVSHRGMPSDPKDLAAHDGLLAAVSPPCWQLERADGATAEARPGIRMVADETTVLLGALRAGLGVACLPAEFCRDELADGTLVRVLDDWTAGGVTTSLLMPTRRGLLPSVRAVADFLAERLSRSEPQRQ